MSILFSLTSDQRGIETHIFFNKFFVIWITFRLILGGSAPEPPIIMYRFARLPDINGELKYVFFQQLL